MKNRILELDFFKGIAILLVICGHVILANLKDALDTHPVYTWIYSFHMPLFFFISGYLISYSSKNMGLKVVKKKSLTLLIPFFLWSFVLFPLFSGNNIYFSSEEFLNPNAQYWFVYLLWLYSMIYYCCNMPKTIGVMGGVIGAFAICLGIANHLYPCELFSRGVQFYPIYVFGVIANKLNLTEKSWIENSWLLTTAFLSFCVASLSYCRMDMALLNKIMKLLASFSICTLVLHYMRIKAITQIGDNKIVSALCYVGKNSIVIYLIHFLMVKVLPSPSLLLNEIPSFWIFVISLLTSVVIACACLLLGKIAERYIWVDRMVFGRGW